jgi:uncharacterized paraquat-inducible protein A
MSRPSRIRRILGWEIVGPSNRFFRPLYVLLDVSARKYSPELSRIGSLEERMKASRRAHLKMMRSGRFWSVLAVFATAGVAGGWLLTAIARPASSIALAVFTPIFGMAYGILVSIAVPRLLRRSYRRALRLELVKRGIPICTECAYDLTGNVSGRCPECGMPAPPSNTTHSQ